MSSSSINNIIEGFGIVSIPLGLQIVADIGGASVLA
jgi:hypothetical protein